jgi:hypothetical protein
LSVRIHLEPRVRIFVSSSILAYTYLWLDIHLQHRRIKILTFLNTRFSTTNWSNSAAYSSVLHQIKKIEDVEYFKYLDPITNNTRRTSDLKSAVAMATEEYNKKHFLFTRKFFKICVKN